MTDELSVLIVGWWPVSLDGNVSCPGRTGSDGPKNLTVRAGASAIRERYEPGVHTINNANPYQGITITEGHGKYPVIFEPLQNV